MLFPSNVLFRKVPAKSLQPPRPHHMPQKRQGCEMWLGRKKPQGSPEAPGQDMGRTEGKLPLPAKQHPLFLGTQGSRLRQEAQHNRRKPTGMTKGSARAARPERKAAAVPGLRPVGECRALLPALLRTRDRTPPGAQVVT